MANNIHFAAGFFALGPVSAVGSALVSQPKGPEFDPQTRKHLLCFYWKCDQQFNNLG